MLAKITSFGGILPARAMRALPGDAAQVCRNLLASVPDFRPVMGDLNVAVSPTNNPLTLYRLDRKVGGSFNTDMTTGWVVKAQQVSYVKGPLNNDTTERTYYTFDDGSAPPRWLDVAGNDRQLGVPKPVSAPTALPVVADEFTPDDRSAQLESAMHQITAILRACLTPNWRGGSEPGTAGSGQSGYVNVQTGYASPASQPLQARLFRLDPASYDGAFSKPIFAAYSAVPASAFDYAYDNALQPWHAPSDGTLPAWAYSGSPVGHFGDNIAISFTAYGLTYDFDAASAKAQIAAIPMPGKTDGTPLFTAAQAQTMVDRVAARVAITDPTASGKVQALTGAVDELRTMMNQGMWGMVTAQYAAYFASAPIDGFLNAQIETWANRVFDIAAQAIGNGYPVQQDSNWGASGP